MAVGFVLGGGGVLGAVEAGMLRALLRAHIKPDILLGTSIGAINAATRHHLHNPDPLRRMRGALALPATSSSCRKGLEARRDVPLGSNGA